MTKPCKSENLRPFYQIQFPECLFRAQMLWNNIVRYIAIYYIKVQILIPDCNAYLLLMRVWFVYMFFFNLLYQYLIKEV